MGIALLAGLLNASCLVERDSTEDHTDARVVGIETIIDPRDTELPAAFLPVPDGFVVLEATSIRIFSASGAVVRTFGRRGDGPGEFQRIVGAAVKADTLTVLDARSGTISVWTLGGELVRTVRVPLDVQFPNMVALGGQLALANGTVGFVARANPQPSRSSDAALVGLITGGSGAQRRTLSVVEGPEWTRGDVPLMGWLDPFGPRDVTARGPRGTFVVGNGVEPCVTLVELLDGSGETLCWDRPRQIRAELPGDSILEGVPEPDRTRYRELLSAQQPSRDLPLFDRLWSDPLRRIWIRTLGDDHRGFTPQLPWIALHERMPDFTWEIRTIDGALAGRAILPGWFDPVDLQGHEVTGVMILSDGRRSLVRLTLDRAP